MTSRAEEQAAGLRFTGHALIDVGLAAVCALNKRRRPEEITLADLDRVSDFIETNYFSGKLDPYLMVVFTSNSGYAGPNKVTDPADYAEVFRAHRVAPGKHLDKAGAGQRCVFSEQPASVYVHRQHLPLFAAEGVMNFRPHGQTAVPIAAPFLTALQFAPMGARRAEGRMLLVHSDDAETTLAFARRYLADAQRLLALALPVGRADWQPAFEREQPVWDAGKKHYKMADAKGPRSLVVSDLAEISGRAAGDLRPGPVSLTVYLMSNAGQGPSIDLFEVPSGLVSFIRRAQLPATSEAWKELSARFHRVGAASRGRQPGRARRKAAAPLVGRAGWSRNPAFEELYAIFDSGFTDRAAAQRWLSRHILGRRARDASAVLDTAGALPWALAELFLKEVLGMKAARIAAIKSFADKLAVHIHRAHDRKLYRALLFDKLPEVRRALRSAQRKSVDGELLFGLDDYVTVWHHDEGNEFLVRDLVAIRVVERLKELGYFTAHPDDGLPAEADEEAMSTREEVVS